MKIICGLGNPGNKYKYTRHNIGFLLVDLFAEIENFQFKPEKKFKADYLKGKFCNHEIVLIKPTTYMNLSGESVLAIQSFYKTNPADLIIIHDDVDLNFGSIRVKQGGGTAGHKGLKSIVSKIGDDFIRIRFGVGKPVPPLDTSDYVLQPFTPNEMKEIPDILNIGIDALRDIFNNGVLSAMNKFN